MGALDVAVNLLDGRIIFVHCDVHQGSPCEIVSAHSVGKFFSFDAVYLRLVGQTFNGGGILPRIKYIFEAENLSRTKDGDLQLLSWSSSWAHTVRGIRIWREIKSLNRLFDLLFPHVRVCVIDQRLVFTPIH